MEPDPIPAGRAPTPSVCDNGMDVLHYALEVALDSAGDDFDGFEFADGPTSMFERMKEDRMPNSPTAPP